MEATAVDKQGGFSRFFNRSRPLLALVAILWLIAILTYFAGQPNAASLDRKTSELVEEIQAASQKALSGQEKRDLVLAYIVTHDHSNFWQGTLLHMSVALFVAGVLVLTVDLVTRHLTREEFKEYAGEVANSVWFGIFRRFVPQVLALEIENVLKRRACWLWPHYTFTFSSSYQDVPPGYVVMERALHYRLRNLTNAEFQHPINPRVVGHATAEVTDPLGKAITAPSIRRCKVAEKEVEINGFPRDLQHVVDLPRMAGDEDAIDVVTEAVELVRENDHTVHAVLQMAHGIEVTVINEISDRIRIREDRLFLTSGFGRLKSTTKQHWRYEGAILPGTAIVLSWEAVTVQG